LAGANEWIGGVVRARPRCTRRSRKSPFQATGMFFHGSNPRLCASLAVPSASTRSRPVLCPRAGSPVARAIARARKPAWAPAAKETPRRVGVVPRRAGNSAGDWGARRNGNSAAGSGARRTGNSAAGSGARRTATKCSTSHLRTDGLEGATRVRFCKREWGSATISRCSVPRRATRSRSSRVSSGFFTRTTTCFASGAAIASGVHGACIGRIRARGRADRLQGAANRNRAEPSAPTQKQSNPGNIR
jgi:hypothetical protein